MNSEFEQNQIRDGASDSNVSVKRQIKFAYQNVYWKIKKKIRDGVYAAGTLIPTENQLMDEYGVSRTTIRRAIAILSDEGMHKVTQGSGSSVTQSIPFHRFEGITHVQEMTSPVPEGFSVHAEVSVDEASVSVEEAYVLEVNPGDMVYRITRFWGYGDRILLIRTNLIPKNLAPDLPIHEKELLNVYPILNEHYGIQLAAAIEDVSVRGATQTEAQIFGVERGSPVFYFVRTARSNKGPMERSYSVLHPDSFKLRIHMDTLPGDDILKLLDYDHR